MNKQLQDFARAELKTGLAELPEENHRTFKLMYARDNGKRSVVDAVAIPINDVVDLMPPEQLDWAMQQVKASLDKMHNAAPEVQQEPVAFEYHGRFSFAHIHQDERFLYTFPPDAQAEITQLKAVIEKCHSALTQCKEWQEGANTLTCHNHEAVEEALAAIKEIDHA